MKLYNAADRLHHWENWHRCFAWRPKTLEDGQVVWLETLERRLKGGVAHFDFDGLIPTFEYRKPQRRASKGD